MSGQQMNPASDCSDLKSIIKKTKTENLSVDMAPSRAYVCSSMLMISETKTMSKNVPWLPVFMTKTK